MFATHNDPIPHGELHTTQLILPHSLPDPLPSISGSPAHLQTIYLPVSYYLSFFILLFICILCFSYEMGKNLRFILFLQKIFIKAYYAPGTVPHPWGLSGKEYSTKKTKSLSSRSSHSSRRKQIERT